MTEEELEQNNFRNMSAERQREIASMGGKASQKALKRRKQIKENIELLLSLPVKNEDIKATLKKMGIEDEEMTNQMAMTLAMWKKALKGDVSAFNSLRDTVGEKPVEVQQVQEVPIIKDDV